MSRGLKDWPHSSSEDHWALVIEKWPEGRVRVEFGNGQKLWMELREFPTLESLAAKICELRPDGETVATYGWVVMSPDYRWLAAGSVNVGDRE